MKDKALKRSLDYIDSWLQLRYEHSKDPGFVVCVSRKGQVLLNRAYGYADLEKKQKMTPQHIFRIASHSKTFTATAIMQLQENGKLKIDDKVVKYLPWLNGHKDKRWQTVTIRQLLSHSAGVVRDGLERSYWGLEKPFPDEPRFKEEILKADLVLDVNTRMKYSNYGFTLLGLVVEAVSGRKYNDYVKENIIDKLDLKNTYPEFSPAIQDKMVTGYTRADYGGKHLPIDHISTGVMSSATGFCSTAEDLCKYFNAHMVGSGKLLDDESKKEMQRAQSRVEGTDERGDYGLGLDIEYLDERKLIGHGGGFPGNLTKSYFDPKDQLEVVVLTNSSGSMPGRLAKSIIKIINYFQENWKGGNESWRKYEGRYMSIWWIADIVSLGDKLAVANALAWEPFHNPEELQHVKGDTFKISKADSYASLEEPAEFIMDGSGRVEKLIYAGVNLYPAKAFLESTGKEKRIMLKKDS